MHDRRIRDLVELMSDGRVDIAEIKDSISALSCKDVLQDSSKQRLCRNIILLETR